MNRLRSESHHRHPVRCDGEESSVNPCVSVTAEKERDTATVRKGVILVGHGGIPKDCLQRFGDETEAAQEPSAARQSAAIGRGTGVGWQGSPLAEKCGDRSHQTGLEAVAARFAPRWGCAVCQAYNEFVPRHWKSRSTNSPSRVRTILPWRPRCSHLVVRILKSRS